MLDIRLIREQPDFVKSRLATRGGDDEMKIDELLQIDGAERAEKTEIQKLQAERKRLNSEIGVLRKDGKSSDQLEGQAEGLNDQIAMRELMLTGESSLSRQREDLLLNIPNLPHAGAPIGTSAIDNPVVRSWGEKPEFDFPVLDHVALGAKLKLFDHPPRAWCLALRASDTRLPSRISCGVGASPTHPEVEDPITLTRTHLLHLCSPVELTAPGVM